MPNAVASQLWAPQWLQFQDDGVPIPAPLWGYGLGWYVRGNWVAWAGGMKGGGSLVLHNLEYDFTVSILMNVKMNAFVDVLPSLLTPACGLDHPACWDTSALGALFPCQDNLNTLADECPGQNVY